MDIAKHTSRTALILLLLAEAALLLVPPIWAGFELCDTGFYATFYDRIFDNPGSVSYNFMYYLSGVAGGVISALTDGSLLWLRIAGAVACLISVGCASDFVRQRSGFFGLFSATALICIGIWQTPLSLYNDNMTAALACVSLALTAGAIRGNGLRRALLLAAAGGAIAGLNTLTRLPNALEILFVVLIPLSGMRGRRLRVCVMSWLGGWAIGLGAGIALAASLGHLPYLKEVISDLASTGAASSEDSTHSFRALLTAQIDAWYKIIMVMIKAAAIGGIGWYIATRISSRILRRAILGLFGIGCLAVIARADIVTSLSAVALFGILGTIFTRSDRAEKTMAFAGLLMMIILPAGSDNGIYNAGTIVLWIAAPAGINFIRRRTGTIAATLICAAMLIPGAVTAISGGFYFDNTPLSEMNGHINEATAKGLLTSEERARRVNELVASAGEFISPGDTLMVYGSAPMINHLTQTVPAIGCSWPELLTPALLGSKLEKGPAPRNIMILRFNTLGARWGEPSDEFARGVGNETNRFHNHNKSAIIYAFIEKNGYKAIQTTPDFELYQLP